MSTFDEGQHPREAAGKFRPKSKPGAGIALAPEDDLEPDSRELARWLESLGEEDRRLANILLDSDERALEGRSIAFDELSACGDDIDDAARVGRALSEHYDYDVSFDLDYEPYSSFAGWEVSADVSTDGLIVREYNDLGSISDQPPTATGHEAALGYARAIDGAMQQVMLQRDREQYMRSMEGMRAMVQVDDLRVSEAPIVFDPSDEDSGESQAPQYATVRTGRWTRDGQVAPDRWPDGTECVRLTMETGRDRFMPMANVVGMLTSGNLARR